MFALLYFGDLRNHASEMVLIVLLWSAIVLWDRNDRGSVWGFWCWAIGIRLCALFLEPTLSDDVYRYIWEGFLNTQGGNPYWTSPLESEVSHWSKAYVNHPDLTSIYPPGAQALFTILSSLVDDVWGVKLLSTLCDLGILWILFRQLGISRGVWIYALHPLPILENSSSGHMESWAIFAMMVAIAFPNIRLLALWLGGMIKLLPAVLIPVSLRSWKDGVVLFLLTATAYYSFSLFSVPRGAQMYAEHWSFHASIYPLLSLVIPHARLVVVVLGSLVVMYVWGWVRPFSRQAFWLSGTFILLSPTVHPWYLLWVFPLAIWHGHRAWLGLCFLYPLWYVALTTWDPTSQSWSPPLWPQVLSYGVFVALLLFDRFRVERTD
jgi:hypothetical protein